VLFEENVDIFLSFFREKAAGWLCWLAGWLDRQAGRQA